MLCQNFRREVLAVVTVLLLAGAIGCSDQVTKTPTVRSTPLTVATFGTNEGPSEQTGPIR